MSGEDESVCKEFRMTTRDIQQLCPTCNSPYTPGAVYYGICGRPVLGVNDKTTQQFSTSMPTSSPYFTSQSFSPVPAGMQKPFWTTRKIFIFSAIMFLLLLLIGGGLFEVAYQLGKNSVQTGNTPPGSTGASGTIPANTGVTSTPTLATPTTIPATASASTPTPTPSPMYVSQPGTVLYQENGSDGWQGWALSSDWRIVNNNKLLSDDGSAGSNQAGPSAIPPFTIPAGVQNFAIEASITLPQALSNAHFSFTACGSTASSGWQGYEGLETGGTALIFADHNLLAQTNFDPGTEPHLYRLEIKGNIVTLFIDHALVVQATDNTFLPYGSQVGVVSSLAIVHVSSFKVIQL
jgi:hypothetical protein